MSLERTASSQPRATSLVDILDRVLDKGLVVAGDIRVSLANVELLTVRIRLLVCSIDKAQEIGLDWWRHDGFLSSQAELAEPEELAALRARVEMLERQLAAPTTPAARSARRAARRQQSGSE
ncbi:MAG TPA: gas vesicle protein [Chloroflexota bacterium]|nr:gas vesicle protein [Chloroflexota bacterium]